MAVTLSSVRRLTAMYNQSVASVFFHVGIATAQCRNCQPLFTSSSPSSSPSCSCAAIGWNLNTAYIIMMWNDSSIDKCPSFYLLLYLQIWQCTDRRCLIRDPTQQVATVRINFLLSRLIETTAWRSLRSCYNGPDSSKVAYFVGEASMELNAQPPPSNGT